MSSLPKVMILAVAVCLIVPLAGCKSSPDQPLKPPVALEDHSNAPEWVDNPEGAFPGDRGKVLYAVGTGPNALNPALTRRRAEQQARIQMSSTMKVKVEAMMKDWMASSTDYADPENTTSKQFTEAVSREVTSATLVGARVAKYWTAPNGTVYCLMALDLNDAFFEAYKNKAKKALQDHQDTLLKGKMEDALADLDKYLEKQQQ